MSIIQHYLKTWMEEGKENHWEIFQLKIYFCLSFDLIQWLATVNYRSIDKFKKIRKKLALFGHSKINVDLMSGSLETDLRF